MIKLLVILVVGVGLGYTYGYMHGAAGDDSIISASLVKVGLQRKPSAAEAEALQARRDSVQERLRRDSIADLAHH